MKAIIKENNRIKNQQNSKSMQLSNLTELSDQEAELVLGGCESTVSTSKLKSTDCQVNWGGGGSGGGDGGGGGGSGGGGW